MHIVHVASEMAPLIKVGGLADVTCGLLRELNKKHDVEIILPRYQTLNEKFLKNLKVVDKNLLVCEKNKTYENFIWSATYDDIPITLIDPKHPQQYFLREQVYGEKDDGIRFLYFCSAVFEYLQKKKKKMDILHIHDWHTAALPVFFDARKVKRPKILLTIHNLQYQGVFKASLLDSFQIPSNHYLTKNRLLTPKNSKKINLLKGGIVYADAVTTVSESYAKEILHKKSGESLDSVLRRYKSKLTGILNGIDPHIWNPRTDPYIKYHYSEKDSLNKLLTAKEKNKAFIQKKLKLKVSSAPLIISIGRLVPQKGPSLIRYGIEETLEKKGQFILLGSEATKLTEKNFHLLQQKLKKNPNVHFHFSYNEELSHQLFAASDYILIPSYFEPCGLTQLIAMRFGCIPIVRRTGGLADTVFDLDRPIISEHKGSGYTFDSFSKKEVKEAIDRALGAWFSNHNTIHQIQHEIMKLDYSWKNSCKKYLTLYKKLLTS